MTIQVTYTTDVDQLTMLSTRLPARERRLLLGQAERYLSAVEERVSRLLPIQVEEGGAGYIVSDNLTDMYGTGPTLEAAHDDYRAALLDAYESLSEADGELSPALQRRFDILKQIFEPHEEIA